MANTPPAIQSQDPVETTNNPQTGGQASSLNGNAKNIQNSGVSSSINTTTSTGGIKLVNQSPQIVPLTAGSQTVATTATVPVQKHNLSPVAVGFVIFLVVLAVGIFMAINRSAKITTDN